MQAWRAASTADGAGRAGVGARAAAAWQRALRLELRRAILWLPAGIGCGIWLYLGAAEEPPIWALAAPLPPALALALPRLRARMAWRALALAPLALALGHAAAQFAALRAAMPGLERPLAGTLEGRVIALDRAASGAPRVMLDRVTHFALAPGMGPPRVRVTLSAMDRAAAPRPGEWVHVHATLLSPGPPVEPGGFDFARRAYFDRIGAIGYARAPALRVPPDERVGAAGPNAAGWPWLPLGRLRLAIADAVHARLPGPEGAFAAAILVGDRAAIDERDAEALRISSLAHLLAISGLHMGLLTGLAFWAVRAGAALAGPALCPWPARKVAAVVALAAGLAYLGLSGATVATQRAFLMALVAFGAVLLDRPAITLRAVALAACLVLLWRPIGLLNPGFQMSFAATVALVAVYEALQRRRRARAEAAAHDPRPPRHVDAPAAPQPRTDETTGTMPWPVAAVLLQRARRLMRWAGALLLTSAVAGAATAPFAALHFNRYAAYGLVANLGAVPAMGAWIAPWGVVAAALAPLGLAGPALDAMGLGITWVLGVARGVAAWPGADVAVAAGPGWAAGAIAAAGLWAAVWRGPWRAAGLAALILAALLWRPDAPDRADVLVAPRGRLVGVLGEAGRALSDAKRQGYAAKRWLRRDGDLADQATAAAR
ncbi:MAG: ComEC/Rec2 family competence protein, partial [Pseudomonadota bacterium]